MVALVVLTAEDAAPVISGAQVLGDLCILGGTILGQSVKHIQVSVLADIDLQSRERALLLSRAIKASVSSPLGFVFAREERQRSESGHALAWFAEQPADDIQIVTRLSDDDRRGLLG